MSERKKHPKVSVVIPVYNVEKYVEEAILSIMNQTLKELEIIVVNDGSTDGSIDIIENLAKKDKRIQIISNPNQGLSIARNLGIYRAIGEYIYFFDSDDILEEVTLKLCYDKCLQDKLDFIFFDAESFADNSLFNVKQFDYRRCGMYKDTVYSGIDILKGLLSTKGYRSSVCLLFINRQFLSAIKLYFFPKIIHEDELFTFLLYLNANRVGFINRVFFHRRVRSNSIITAQYSLRNAMGYITVCRELHSFNYRHTTVTGVKKMIRYKIKEILSGVIYVARIRLSSRDFNQIRAIVFYEFKRYIGWKTLFKMIFPKSFLSIYNKL